MDIKAATLLHPEFPKAMESLLKKEMPIAQCVKLSEAINAIEEHTANVNRVRKNLVEQYVLQDKNGNPVMAGSNVKYKDPAKKQEFMEKTQELLDQTFEIDFDEKIILKAEDNMSPQHFLLLKNFVDYKEV